MAFYVKINIKHAEPIFVRTKEPEILKKQFLEDVENNKKYYVVKNVFEETVIVKTSEILSLQTCSSEV